jgi:hypothetical protein
LFSVLLIPNVLCSFTEIHPLLAAFSYFIAVA